MNGSWKEWRFAAGLLTLCIIPVAAGMYRVVQIFSSAPITGENMRFMTAPLPAVLHIFTVTVYCVIGAFQFVPLIRSRYLSWHRTAGRILVICGLTASLTGLWMTFFYEWPKYDGFSLYIVRVIVGLAMTFSLIFGYTAIRRGDRQRHRVWMMRGYALGLGAGTQVLTHIPWALFPEYHGETFRTISMAAGWCINLCVVEWLLFRRRSFAKNTEIREILM